MPSDFWNITYELCLFTSHISDPLYENQTPDFFDSIIWSTGSSLGYFFYCQNLQCAGSCFAASAGTMILGYFFFPLQPGAKLARAHPPKYRSITSLQIAV